MDKLALRFADRADAGRQLGERLAALGLDDPVIFALPRGGVPVAVEVARRLEAPLDLILVRKIGAPGNPEVALGAIVENSHQHVVINEDVRRSSGADDAYLARALADQMVEIDRRRKSYLGNRTRLYASGRVAVVVDDGLATGATMKAALIALRRNGAARIVVALPVAPRKALEDLTAHADEIVCLHPADAFYGVGSFYRDFHQLSDEETIALLNQCPAVADGPNQKSNPTATKRRVTIPPLGLIGNLVIPTDARGIIMFAYGSGSSRKSPRNVQVATQLNILGFATLLFDLLTPAEAQDRRNVFDIPLLAERVVEATMWISSEPEIADLPLGLFGASTGASAALIAAAELKDRVTAVVSRGGRVDLAHAHLADVLSPTLLLVGDDDHKVLAQNEQALVALNCKKKLLVIPGADCLFEEPGTLALATKHAGDWFKAHLISPASESLASIPKTSDADLKILKRSAEPLAPISDLDFAKAFDRFGSCRVVLLGEASHGTSEFYTARAEITRRLIEHHGFSIVAVEADWPDAATVDRHIRQFEHLPVQPAPFSRFPTWMWRNKEFQRFVEFLHLHNGRKSKDDRVAFYGLDLYNMNASIDAVLTYLDRVDPAAAKAARARYACLMPWSRNPAAYGREALSHGFAACEKPVTEILVDLMRKRLDYLNRDGDRFFDATGNARLIANAERYYRAMYYGAHVSWNLRDQHMFGTLHQILEHSGPDQKAVVWAHNFHIGDARSTDMGRTRGELNIGQLCREKYGDEVALIGFGTACGTVAAASEWDAPMEIKTLRQPRPGSVEALCQTLNTDRFLFDFKKEQNDALRDIMVQPRLERYVGVIYRPETERASHYGYASLSEQYDGFVWINQTTAVTPLPTLFREGEDETYPFGV